MILTRLRRKERLIAVVGACTTLLLISTAQVSGQNTAGIRSGSALNNIVINITEYVGDCPGAIWERPEVSFVSSTPPAEDRRVRIFNRSIMDEEPAYTDREYEDGGDNPYISTFGSETFRVRKTTEHTTRALALDWGENDMVAVIYDGGRRDFLEPEEGFEEIAVHEFAVDVEHQKREIVRDRITTSPVVECEDSTISLSQCPENQRARVSYSYCAGESRHTWRRSIVDYVVPRSRGSHGIVTLRLHEQGLLDDGNRYRDHTFQGKAGQVVTITMASDEFDTALTLLGPSGRAIAENDDIDRSNANSRITATLPITGRYRIRAGTYRSGYGRYDLVLR